MKKCSLFIFIFLTVQSITLVIAQEHFCQTRAIKTDSFSVLENTLALDNEGGLFGLNTGVCWWNSWFLLRANYLLKFAPECPGPDIKTKDGRKFYRKLYLKLLNQDTVIILPGYKNLRELTSDPYQKDVLQRALQTKMAQDSFFRLKFIEAFEGRGHWGERTISQSKKDKWIKRQISELKQISNFIQSTGPAYVMLQNPGISTHALIIFRIEQNENEFVIYAQDSNYQSRLIQVPHSPYRILHYRDGQWFDDKYGQKLTFHIYHKRELQVTKTIERYDEYCSDESMDNYCPTW